MLFNSSHFLLFFPVVFILFYVLPHRFRWAMLLVASYYFYMSWNPWYILLLVTTTAVDYLVARQIDRSSSVTTRKYWLTVSIVVNLSLLFYFKYYNFFIDNINSLSGSHLKYMQFLLPVGISFYTFQEMGYVIDVYRGKLSAERHLGKFALFVSYFPQLVAGPIERASHLLHQLKERVVLRYENLSVGIKLIVWGFFKKVVIADNLAPIVDAVYDHPEQVSGKWILLATYFFAFQIYCDFSGYSDIAIGVARTMGVRLMQNFNLPYLASGIRDFWSRWHISLSTWFRDYLYIPLGGNRMSPVRTSLNLFAVFAISGLWHGANWTFVIWGMLHGAYLLVEKIKVPPANWRKGKIFRWLKVLFIFHLVLFGWIFFRADHLNDAVEMLQRIVHWTPQSELLPGEISRLGSPGILFKVVLLIFFLALDPLMVRWMEGHARWNRWAMMAFFAFLAACIVLFGNWGEVSFIYFQF